jgi:hypothetical protein
LPGCGRLASIRSATSSIDHPQVAEELFFLYDRCVERVKLALRQIDALGHVVGDPLTFERQSVAKDCQPLGIIVVHVAIIAATWRTRDACQRQPISN